MTRAIGVLLLACAPDVPATSGDTGTGSSATTGSSGDESGDVDPATSTGPSSSDGSSDATTDAASTGSTGAPAQWCGREERLVRGSFQFAGGTEVVRIDDELFVYSFRGSATGFSVSRYRVEDGEPVLEVELPTNGSGYVRDFNGDGLLDVWTSPNILVQDSEVRFGVVGPDVLADPTPVDHGDKILPRLVALADFDGDGSLDVMSHVSSWSTVYIALSNGTGEYLPEYEGPGPAELGPGGVAHAATALHDPTRIAIDYGRLVMHRLVGSTIVIDAMGPEGYRARVLDVHDDDGDDLTEAYVVADGSVVHVEATPDGMLETTELFATHDHTFARDFDGDGDVDILRWGDGNLALFHERFSGGFEDGVEVDLSPLPPEPRVSALRDFDFDGDGDMVYGVTDPGGTDVYAVSVEACR